MDDKELSAGIRFIDAEDGYIYASFHGGVVAKINANTLKVEKKLTIEQGYNLEGVAISNNMLYVANSYKQVDGKYIYLTDVFVIDLKNFTLKETLTVAGDYVLTGGELPAMMMIDCISRLVPGVLNNNVSAEFETFHDNLLEYPQYTRPEVFMGKKVPDILLSGHHANVEKWRREQSIIRTLKNRPELLEDAVLSKKEQKFLYELLRQQELENAQKVKNKEKASAEHDGEETA